MLLLSLHSKIENLQDHVSQNKLAIENLSTIVSIVILIFLCIDLMLIRELINVVDS